MQVSSVENKVVVYPWAFGVHDSLVYETPMNLELGELIDHRIDVLEAVDAPIVLYIGDNRVKGVPDGMSTLRVDIPVGERVGIIQGQYMVDGNKHPILLVQDIGAKVLVIASNEILDELDDLIVPRDFKSKVTRPLMQINMVIATEARETEARFEDHGDHYSMDLVVRADDGDEPEALQHLSIPGDLDYDNTHTFIGLALKKGFAAWDEALVAGCNRLALEFSNIVADEDDESTAPYDGFVEVSSVSIRYSSENAPRMEFVSHGSASRPDLHRVIVWLPTDKEKLIENGFLNMIYDQVKTSMIDVAPCKINKAAVSKLLMEALKTERARLQIG